jgi:hypothetical protein
VEHPGDRGFDPPGDAQRSPYQNRERAPVVYLFSSSDLTGWGFRAGQRSDEFFLFHLRSAMGTE